MRRARHREVLEVLSDLDALALRDASCLFGGGTRVAIEFDEFRVSADVDLLVSDARGYAALRTRVRQDGAGALFVAGTALRFPRQATTDQYGIRFPVAVRGGDLLKLEIVHEGRIRLEPGVRPAWSPVDCLSDVDTVAEKLLANSDRWADPGSLSRDLLDLAAFRVGRGPLPDDAFEKASSAYGAAARADLGRATVAFLDNDRESHRTRCFQGLEVEAPDRLLDGVRSLRDDLA